MSSAIFIPGISLIAIFAYSLSSDKTQFANQMHLSIHSQLPGFSCKVLIIPGLKSYGNRSFFFGDRNISEEIPIKEIRWHNKGLTFKRHGNATNYFEEKLFSQFPPGTTRKEVEAKYLKEKYFILGTDKYGRDLLSRLIIGSRISISIGFVAVTISLLIGVFLGSIAGFFWRKDRSINYVDNQCCMVDSNSFNGNSYNFSFRPRFLASFCCSWTYYVG
jgi:peptide/nickel transport system permease protein